MTGMTQVNARTLHLSKWTAVEPRNKEKHFLVVEVSNRAAGLSGTCILEAVISLRRIKLDCRELNDSEKWRVGWR
jgi:tryptophan-rich hypothetical protein